MKLKQLIVLPMVALLSGCTAGKGPVIEIGYENAYKYGRAICEKQETLFDGKSLKTVITFDKKEYQIKDGVSTLHYTNKGTYTIEIDLSKNIAHYHVDATQYEEFGNCGDYIEDNYYVIKDNTLYGNCYIDGKLFYIDDPMNLRENETLLDYLEYYAGFEFAHGNAKLLSETDEWNFATDRSTTKIFTISGKQTTYTDFEI